MGLLNARNLRRAKALLDNNRHKVGGVVEKAGTQLDKVSKGKTSNFTSKATDAAKKYSDGSARHHGFDTPPLDDRQMSSHPVDDADVRRSQAEAAGAVTGAANALTNFMNKAAEKIEQTPTAPKDSDDVPPPLPGDSRRDDPSM